MILTITNNELLIADSWIDDFVNDTATIEIQYTYNCGETVIVSPLLVDINDNNQYVLPITDGVYLIKLINTTESTLEVQTKCVAYISDTTRCNIIEKVAEKCNTDLLESYIALQLVNGCTECDCTKACTIYESFLKELNNECNC